MKNAFFCLRIVARVLLYCTLLAILLSVIFMFLPDHGSEFSNGLPVAIGIGALAFRLDAHTMRDLVTGKRLLVAFLMCMWSGLGASAGVSIVGGHYSVAVVQIFGSLIFILAAQPVFYSAPEQWLGRNWRKELGV